MKNDEKSYGLLLAAIVAIVAIVGMVILFSKSMDSGALVMSGKETWSFPEKINDNPSFSPDNCGPYHTEYCQGYGNCRCVANAKVLENRKGVGDELEHVGSYYGPGPQGQEAAINVPGGSQPQTFN